MLPLLKAVNMARGQDGNEDQNSEFTDKVLNGLLAGAIGLGSFLLIRKVVRNMKQRKQQKNALNPGDPASDAIQLKMAFENDNYFGWGTNEELVFNVLESIPDSSFMRKVQKAYRNLYNTELVADMQSELDTKEFAKALAIINSKP
ncbi:hypothetical protein C900_02340 [Fulvivirga imtechensis AK7]|uniref:Annexin n=1 Tax=Fulvivirga imtechensis AK7 TaxID=1237149 RepID=L8JSE6_9BACT|nr:hypothetical protein [Fulvivirga imtechensis]ELR71755.1 hypothetical protein C900_02340 [Fulvivirga imtechensis AK7]